MADFGQQLAYQWRMKRVRAAVIQLELATQKLEHDLSIEWEYARRLWVVCPRCGKRLPLCTCR